MSGYTPRNILVTGGAGFIGANYIQYALQQDSTINIINLDLLTYAAAPENLKNIEYLNRYHFIQGDICNYDLVHTILRQYQIDTIVHFAAESHVDRSILVPGEFIKTNINGTFTLLEAAKTYWIEAFQMSGAKCRFHHISTDEVFGSLTNDMPAFSETTAYAPNSPYSASKAGSDHLVRAYFHTYNLPITISNCSNNYGPYQHAEKFIPTIIRACLKQQSIPIYGNGKNIRDWLYVVDHCNAIDLIIRKGQVGESYNVGGDNEHENIEVVKIICELLDSIRPANMPYTHLISYVKDRPGHDWRYAINASKIKLSLGWKPQTSFIDGLKQTVKWTLTYYDNQLANVNGG